MIVGISEKSRWDPFYTPMKCTSGVLALPLSLVSWPPGTPGMPAGQPPYGMYGNISSTMTCENRNQADVTMIRDGSVSHMLLPNDGLSYTEIARAYLDGDVSIPSGGKVTITSTAEVAFPLSSFGKVLGMAALQGYVPIYTRSVGVAESCASLFGIRSCAKKSGEQWCGVLGGQCVTEVDTMPGVLVPAVCSLTRTICKESEAEMKALVIPKNLDLQIVAVQPCPPGSNMPPGTNCSFPAAPGLEAGTGKARAIASYIDDMDPPQEDIDEAESAIGMATTLAIVGGGVLGTLCITIAAVIMWNHQRGRRARDPAGAPQPALPTVLASDHSHTVAAVVCKV
jgi:hypothetical protein